VPEARLSGVLSYLRRLAFDDLARADADLLRRFLSGRDQAAFAALVGRHGPLVLGVCRRILRHEQDVEDAFQATFLVLARKAGCIGRPELLGNWLHGVALRTARKARARVARQPRCAEGLDEVPARAEEQAIELRGVLDEELERLPEKYRSALVLCCLAGLTREEAADRLGRTPGAVKGLLERGRERLRRRLAQRGVSVGLLPLALAVPSVPAALAGATTEAGPAFAAGNGGPGPAAALAESVLRGMTMIRWKAGLALLLLLGVGGSGSAFLPPTLEAPLERKAAAARRAPEKPAPAKPVEFKHPGGVHAVAYSPKGNLIATAGADKSVRLWEASTGKEAAKLVGHAKAVRAVAFSRDGKLLASGDDDGVVWLWKVSGYKRERKIQSSGVEVLSLAFSRDGKELATAGRQKYMRFWQVHTGKEIAAWRGKDTKEAVQAVVYSPDGKQVLLGGQVTLNVGNNWSTFYLRDRKTGKDVLTAQGPRQGFEKIAAGLAYPPPLAFAPDGKTWAVAASDNNIHIGGKGIDLITAHKDRVTALVYLPNGKTLISASLDGTIRFWDPKTLDERARLSKQGKLVGLALSPSGKRLASATADGTVRVRDVAQLMKKHRLKKPEP
jgi:RNA polymerase sigma factor (sigma-70 family)